MVIQRIKQVCNKVNKEVHLRTDTGRKSSLFQTSRPTGSQYKQGGGFVENLISATSDRVLIILH
jgi:hypothetical protein